MQYHDWATGYVAPSNDCRVCFELVLLDCVLRGCWARSIIFSLITCVLVQRLIRHPHPALLAPGACNTLAKLAHNIETHAKAIPAKTMTLASLIPNLCGVVQFYIQRNCGGTKSDICRLMSENGFPDWPPMALRFISKSQGMTHAISGGKHVATVEPTHQALTVVSTDWSSTVRGTIGCFDASVSYGIIWRFPLLRHVNAFNIIWLNFLLNCDQGLLSQPLHGAEVSVLELKTSNKNEQDMKAKACSVIPWCSANPHWPRYSARRKGCWLKYIGDTLRIFQAVCRSLF